ncbi:MAG: hypothetical protein SFU91_11345 [Chloroherpetonaceae bacterium]|nr:hypothetical protein [Chloroherpetonaceae bacterium]
MNSPKLYSALTLENDQQSRSLFRFARVISESTSANLVLFVLGTVEGFIFPMPIDESLIALSVINPKRSFRYMTMAVFGSVLGGFIAFGIGHSAWPFVLEKVIEPIGWAGLTVETIEKYQTKGFSILLFSGFMPVPFCLFNYLAGASLNSLNWLDIESYAVALWFSRVIKFLPISLLVYFFGERISPALEKYFSKFLIGFGVLLFVMFVITNWIIF